jgi:polar amino acid transport system permease protein
MIWNVYFAVLALAFGFFFAVAVALARPRKPLDAQARGMVHLRLPGLAALHPVLHGLRGLRPAAPRGVEFTFLGVAIEAETRWFARAWLGALIVLFSTPPPIRPRSSTARSARSPRAIWRPPMPMA